MVDNWNQKNLYETIPWIRESVRKKHKNCFGNFGYVVTNRYSNINKPPVYATIP